MPALSLHTRSSRAPEDGEGPHGGHHLPGEKLWGSHLIPNQGSTARDYLARERNFMSWIKLTVSLAVISVALLVRFQFGSGTLPEWEQRGQMPLGILFFVASLGSLVSAILTFYRSQSGYARHKAFVYAGRAADALMISIAVLTLTTCIIILVADPTT
ncbi:hypothetical protein BMF94_4389 [Rhodotorula taiwanensis]|uniref:DUF202 domain-containing protein n=1 Tax=Rhodotorula taiwanensis TaxID=741276 RepID=A0A2S5B703_9BASI|nr:hypothetical protein BMF94_4389 [Rhodotorula taiwanensis]